MERDMALLGFGDFIDKNDKQERYTHDGLTKIEIPVRPAKGYDEAIKSIRALSSEER